MKKAACTVVILLTSAICCFATPPPFCITVSIPTIELGVLNEKAKVLPMPQLDKRNASIVKRDIRVRVIIDLQLGKVRTAYAESNLPRAINDSVVRAARNVRFEAVTEGFSSLQGAGTIIYKVSDVNREIVSNGQAPGLFTRDETLKDKATLLPMPRPLQVNDSVFKGQVRVAAIVNARDGKVVAVKAVYGLRVLDSVADQAAYQARFLPSPVKGDVPEYLLGTIEYNIGGEGSGSAEGIDMTSAAPKDRVAYAEPVELPGITYKPCSSSAS